MTRNEAITLLGETFRPEHIQEYVERADIGGDVDYWAHFDTATELLRDVRLYFEAKELTAVARGEDA